MRRQVISTKGRGKLEAPYSKAGDLVVDCLLLRYLSSRISHSYCGTTVLAYLVVGYGLTKSFDEFRNLSGIPSLIYEPSNLPLFPQSLGLLPNLFQCTTKTVDKGGRGEQSANVPGQLFASPGLLGVSVDSCRCDFLLEPVQLGSKILDLVLDIFELLPLCVSAVRPDK